MAIEETISVDAGPAIAGLNEFASAAEAAAAKVDAAFKSIKVPSLGGSGAANMARSMDAAATKMAGAVDKMDASFAKLKASGAEAGAAMGDIGKAGAESAAGLGDAAKGANEAAASYARLGKASRDSAAMMDEQAVAGRRASKSSAEAAAGGTKFWGGLKTVMLGAGVAAAYGIDKAMKFQSQMLLLHTQAGVSAGDVKKMSQGALSISTQTGQSLSDVAESAYHVASNMASMGTSVPKMLEATKIAAEGASVGHANMVDTTNALTAAIASGIPGVKDYSQAMGVLNKTVGSGDMSMQDLADAFGTGMVASVKGYGLSIKDVGAGLAVLGDNNIRGAKAGTDFRMAVQSLAVPASSAKKELASLGLTTGSLAKDMQSGGLLKALDDLQGKFKAHGITAKNEGQVITDLFGKKAGVGLSILMEQMDRLHSKYPELTDSAGGFGKAWQATQASPAQKWKETVAGLKASATGFGTELLPAFTKVTGFANKLLGDINGSKAGATAMAVSFGGIAALFAGKKLFSGVESAAGTIGKIGKFLNIPGLDKLAGIGGAGASGSLAAVATSGDAAAAALGRLAGVAGEESLMGAPGAGGGMRLTPSAAEAEADMGLGGALRAGAGGLLAGGMVAAIAIPLAMQADKLIQKHLGNTQASGYAQIGTGALAGAATGAAIGSVIPGLGTATGAIAGAIVGSLTTALKNPKVWNEIAGAPTPPGKPHAAPPPKPVWQIPGTGGKPMPGVETPPGKNPTWGWAIADAADRKRHAISAGFDRARHDTAAAADWVGGSFDTTRHQVASFGQQFAELFGYRPPKPPAGPSVAPLGYMNQYPSGKPFYGEQPSGVAQPMAVTPSRGPTLQGIAAHPGAQLAVPAVKVPPPDLSAVTAVKAKLTADLSNVPIKPAKVPAPDMSGANSAKGKATSLGSSITSAIQGAMKPAKMPPPNLSAASAAAGAARADGANISAGLAAGILAGEGAVVAAASQVASAAAAAMAHAVQSHSPSKKTEKTGKDMTAGLVIGLQGGQDAVNAAATALGKNAAKATDIAAIDAAAKKLISEVPKGDSAVVKMLKADNKALDNMARQRTKLEQEISDSEQVATNAIGGASVMNSLNAVNPAGNEPIASSAVITGQQYQASSMKQFAQQVTKLQKMGLNATALSQIAQAGPDQGLGIAQAITSGGPAAIRQLNQLQKQIHASAAQIGNVGGPAMYQSGKDIAAGLADGLKADLAGVDKAMEKLAKSMVASVSKHAKTAKGKAAKAAAGAAGDSTAGGGTSSGAGGASGDDGLTAAATALSAAGTGLSSAATALSAAAASLKKDAAGSAAGGSHAPGHPVAHPVSAAASSGAHPVAAAAASGGHGGGGTVHHTTNVTVQGTVTAERDLLNSLQNLQLKRASNNHQGGWKLPGRGT